MNPEDTENKMMNPPAQKADDPGKVTLKAASGILNEYHFPGVPFWKPVAITASTYAEALHIWLERRQPTKSKPEKVEAETKPTNE